VFVRGCVSVCVSMCVLFLGRTKEQKIFVHPSFISCMDGGDGDGGRVYMHPSLPSHAASVSASCLCCVCTLTEHTEYMPSANRA
jgi:hypothetical protein